MQKILLLATTLALLTSLPIKAQTTNTQQQIIRFIPISAMREPDPASCTTVACQNGRKAKIAKEKWDKATGTEKEAALKEFKQAVEIYLKAAVEDGNPQHIQAAMDYKPDPDFVIRLYKYLASDKNTRTILYQGIVNNIVSNNCKRVKLSSDCIINSTAGTYAITCDPTVCPTGGNTYYTVLEWANEEGIARDQARIILNHNLGQEWLLNYLDPKTYRVRDVELEQMYVSGKVKAGQYIAPNKEHLSLSEDLRYYLGLSAQKKEIINQRQTQQTTRQITKPGKAAQETLKESKARLQKEIDPYLLKSKYSAH
ncbi:MAG: hypothetical protein LBI01_02060 [Elusimicrobium sp.]|jgi:hypothetical protein|nr:hypothetical protein [Elusimicrobium sp.]